MARACSIHAGGIPPERLEAAWLNRVFASGAAFGFVVSRSFEGVGS
jgi:hypothetical protein